MDVVDRVIFFNRSFGVMYIIVFWLILLVFEVSIVLVWISREWFLLKLVSLYVIGFDWYINLNLWFFVYKEL